MPEWEPGSSKLSVDTVTPTLWPEGVGLIWKKRFYEAKHQRMAGCKKKEGRSVASSILGINWIKGRQSHISWAPFTSFLSNGSWKSRYDSVKGSILSLALLPTSTNSSPHNQHTPYHHPCFLRVCFQHQFELAVYLFTKRITVLQSASPHTLFSQRRICWSLLNI